MTERNAMSLIDGLVQDLQPVAPMRSGLGWLMLLAALFATVLAVIALSGKSLHFDAAPAQYYVAQGFWLVLGLAAASSVIAMVSPRVGNRYDGPKWAAAMAATMPASALLLLFRVVPGSTPINLAQESHCAAWSLASSVLLAAALIIWLRRGAPASPTRASYLVGVAAGALGTFAYGITCPIHTIQHLGIWHFLPIAASAAICRFAVPPLLRW